MSRRESENREMNMVRTKFSDNLKSRKEFERRQSCKSNILRIELHTTIFASMCPDEILDNYDDYNTRSYNTTLMLGDVSGFTKLTEKYTESSKEGLSKLTEILNTYIGAMIQEILSLQGDVLKFSGDAFIVMWKLQKGLKMHDIAIKAIQTACIIQKQFGNFQTDLGVTLKVKLAIASGKTNFTSIGKPKLSSYYIITGKPVWDVKYAEGLCSGGDIIVAPSCWQWVNPNEYIYTKLPDGIHILIWASLVLYDTVTNQENFKDISAGTKLEQANNNLDFQTTNYNQSQFEKQYYPLEKVDYSLRPKVFKAAKNLLKNSLSSYILRPVIRSVELDEPIEYITEMRQVVIVFVNVITKNVDKKRLIRLVNYAYISVCGIVHGMQGCVNKTSLFDKDLIFLCIFGLRGDKHELESQIGLRCASIIRQTLIKMNNIQSVTVGVTTGMTYCGVVGHILRREYTVIGMTVNKAARLMCVYTDKVVCDRETFLHSHLEARHFVLQEHKYIKGITSIGPVYEFLEKAQHSESELIISTFPLLGRDKELKVFEILLNNVIKSRYERTNDVNVRPDQSVFIVRGEPRIGKTRLMEEFTQLVPSNVSLNFISLISEDGQIPYRLLYFIFCAPIEFSDKSSVKERTHKLLNHLKNSKELEHLCVLNEPFKVNFKVNFQYRILTKHERQQLLRRFLVRLMYSCFRKLWVIFIDDAEYADGESISLLKTLVKLDLVLFVISLGQKVANAYSLHKEIIERAVIIDLLGLKRLFHAALACQFLNCQAIPAELEKIIQKKSMGNPGWIESYLISVEQSGGLTFRIVSKTEIINMGLVAPPQEILIRKKLQEFDDQKPNADKWKMFLNSFKESDLEAENKKIEMDNDHGSGIKICLLTPKFGVEDLETEVTMEVIILKLFDSLNPLHQLLLKCAAVLGEIVNRKMMENLMQGTTKREIATAVAKLFEMKLLGCAVDRSRGPDIFLRKLPSSNNVGLEVHCSCSGIEIDDSLAYLPKYAFCQLMRFQMTMLRETTYRLLTENQKVELHYKAIKYLQKYTKRCESCGKKQFAKLLGKTFVEDKIPRRTVNFTDYVTDVQTYFNNPPEESKICLPICQSVEKVPTRTFSQMDFSNCQCNMILLTAYSQLVTHCRGIGMKNKLLMAILEFTDVCISTYNIPLAQKLATEGEAILSQVHEDEAFTVPYLKGKIYTLQGRCFLENGFIPEAAIYFDLAVNAMGYNFPKSKFIIKIKTAILFNLLKQMLTWFRPCKIGILDGIKADFMDEFANCLAQMFIIFRINGMKDHAHLAAIWGLSVALTSSKNFLVLCKTYTNMIYTAHSLQLRTIIPCLENDGLRICSEKNHDFELQELKAVGELYSSIFFSRWLQGMTLKASNLGFIANRIVSSVHLTKLQLVILPRLIHLMLMNFRQDEAICLLREMDNITNNIMDKSGRTWYYALCIDVLLEAGISIIPFYKCEKFYQEEIDIMFNLGDLEAERRFFVCMWLWYIRIGDWETAAVWKNRKAVNLNVITDEQTVVAAITILKRVEGLLIFYVNKVDNTNANAAAETLFEIKEIFKFVKKLQKVAKVISCRYYLMKAYYHMVRFQTSKGFKLLKKSKILSHKFQIKRLYKWADHNEKAWISLNEKRKETCMIKGIFESTTVLQSNEIRHKNWPYTLPLPKVMQ